jgi:hypothetical protein
LPPAYTNGAAGFIKTKIDDADFTTGLINPETGSEYPSLSWSVGSASTKCAAACRAETWYKPIVLNPGKMLVSLCPTTLAFTMVKADAVTAGMFNFDADTENMNMTSLFGFTTDHARVNELQLGIRQCLPLRCYITLYTSDWKRPVPVHLTLTPVPQKEGMGDRAPGFAVLSILDAGSIGWLTMQAKGFVL